MCGKNLTRFKSAEKEHKNSFPKFQVNMDGVKLKKMTDKKTFIEMRLKKIIQCKLDIKRVLAFFLLFMLLANKGAFAFQKELPELEFWTMVDLDKAITYCEYKTRATLNHLKAYDKLPKTIPAGEKHWQTQQAGDWTSGFWAGILWYMYDATENEKIRIEAEKFTDEVGSLLNKPFSTYELGFMLNSSFGNGYRLTGNKEYKKILLNAADTIVQLFDKKAGTFLSWPSKSGDSILGPHNSSVDDMLNLELLFWASQVTKSKNMARMANSHAYVLMNNHIRTDSTMFQVSVYDKMTGECVRKKNSSGYTDSSTWSRGQALGIYGFTMCYRETGDVKYLRSAEALLVSYLSRLPDDFIPYWDFNDPKIPNAPKDVSAAAIVASALFELSEHQNTIYDKRYYREFGERILWSLSSPKYLSYDENDSFLMHSTGNKPKNEDVDVSSVYADYFYLEALTRLQKILQQDRKMKYL
jgi:unsaturated chondroitin disaccharide hydrolase